MQGLYIGLMSGTSTDAVDGILVRLSPMAPPHTLSFASTPIPQDLRHELLLLNQPQENELHRSALASLRLIECYEHTVHTLLNQSSINPENIVAIGAHGQTIRHRPELGYTIQLNAPALLAEKTAISVISDFRSRDIAAGGQGAPLVPAFHASLLPNQQAQNIGILNLGGIANASLLYKNGYVTGFDTGPANMLMDLWCERHTGQAFDTDGLMASQGQLSTNLLDHLINSEPWFGLPPPKSTGRDLFNASWLDQRLPKYLNELRTEDIQSTLLELTATTSMNAIKHIMPDAEHIYVCGGGALNPRLLERLGAHAPCPISPTDRLGVPVMHMEALAFAWLAYQHMSQQAANLPAVTGARGARILGAHYPA